MRLLWAGLVATALTACNGAGLSGVGLTLPSAASAPVEVLSISGGVEVLGPDGFCIDRRASRPRTGFVILGNCSVLGGEEAAQRGALITVQVGERDSAIVAGNEDQLVTFLRSGGGGLLGEGARITSAESRDGLVLTRIEGPAPAELGAVLSDRWRGFADIKGRLVSVTVYSLQGEPISSDQGQTLLQRALVRMIVRNSP